MVFKSGKFPRKFVSFDVLISTQLTEYGLLPYEILNKAFFLVGLYR